RPSSRPPRKPCALPSSVGPGHAGGEARRRRSPSTALGGRACPRLRPAPGSAEGCRWAVARHRLMSGMLSLLLLRHAKSSWDDPALADFDGPLASRGEEAARRMGAYMAAQELAPDLIMCSTAERARQTLEIVLERLGADLPTRFADALYLATPTALLACVGK